jgi:hypothetical protein
MGNKPLVVILGLVHEVWFTALKPKHGHIMYIYIVYLLHKPDTSLSELNNLGKWWHHLVLCIGIIANR